jgi:hypothetical protein
LDAGTMLLVPGLAASISQRETTKRAQTDQSEDTQISVIPFTVNRGMSRAEETRLRLNFKA